MTGATMPDPWIDGLYGNERVAPAMSSNDPLPEGEGSYCLMDKSGDMWCHVEGLGWWWLGFTSKGSPAQASGRMILPSPGAENPLGRNAPRIEDWETVRQIHGISAAPTGQQASAERERWAR